MTSIEASFDPNAYAHRQQDHHQRMLKQFQMGSKAGSNVSFSASFSDPSNPHTPSRPETSASGDSFSLPSPPPITANVEDLYAAQQKQQPVMSPYAYGNEGVFVDPSSVNPAWVPHPYYGQLQPQANSSQGLGLDFTSFQQPCDEALGYSFVNGNFGYSAGQPFSVPFGASAINPNFVQLSQVDKKNVGVDSMEYPQSPLRSISGSTSPAPINAKLEEGIKGRLRRTSDSSFARSNGSGKRGHKRKTTWCEGMAYEGPNVSREQKEHELAQLERMEDDADPDERRARRRLQNRLAQRAFRARSKVHNREAQSHLTELEDLVESQNEQIQSMSNTLDRLQRENAALKAGNWAIGNSSYNFAANVNSTSRQ